MAKLKLQNEEVEETVFPVETEVNPELNCPTCKGTGLKNEFNRCETCLGTGKI